MESFFRLWCSFWINFVIFTMTSSVITYFSHSITSFFSSSSIFSQNSFISSIVEVCHCWNGLSQAWLFALYFKDNLGRSISPPILLLFWNPSLPTIKETYIPQLQIFVILFCQFLFDFKLLNGSPWYVHLEVWFIGQFAS